MLSRLPLVLGAASGLVVCALALALLMFLNGRSPDPHVTAQALCADLRSQDYASLYSTLAPQAQAIGTQTEFAASQRQLDALSGNVMSCTADVRQANAAQAQLALTLTRSRAGTIAGAVHLMYLGGAWKIDSYDAGVI